MFERLLSFGRKAVKVVIGTVAAVTAVIVGKASAVYAAMSPADVTATTTGISDAMALFYTIGGSILVVCAAIWGFKRVKALLG